MRPAESTPNNDSQGITLALMVGPGTPNLSRSHDPTPKQHNFLSYLVPLQISLHSPSSATLGLWKILLLHLYRVLLQPNHDDRTHHVYRATRTSFISIITLVYFFKVPP